MRQGNGRIIVIHPLVFGLIIFLSLLVESKEYVKGKYYGIFSNLSQHGQKILLRN